MIIFQSKIYPSFQLHLETDASLQYKGRLKNRGGGGGEGVTEFKKYKAYE